MMIFYIMFGFNAAYNGLSHRWTVSSVGTYCAAMHVILIQIRAVRRCHFGWRRARCWRPKNVCSKIPEKFRSILKIFGWRFLVIVNCNKISTQQQWHRQRADKLSAAAGQALIRIAYFGIQCLSLIYLFGAHWRLVHKLHAMHLQWLYKFL